MAEYSLHDHGPMIGDRIRTGAYARALERTVRPGSIVLDIGAGSGILSMLAARAGARHVFAVEPEAPIELARELAAANGVAEMITFIRDLSTKVTLPERADVVVSDLHGVLPLHRGNLPAMADAQRRHLAPGGALIPHRDTLWVGPAELPGLYEQRVSSWGPTPYGLDLVSARRYGANDWLRVRAPADALLTAPVRLAAIEYTALSGPNLKASAQSTATRAGTLHGLVVWFDSELSDGVGFSNAPGEPELIYGQGFFPLLEPVELELGDLISVDFAASLLDGEYTFRWDTNVSAASAPERIKASFTQSTVFASPVSPDMLASARAGHAPTRTEEGDRIAFVLDRLDGSRTLADLADELAATRPELADEALALVTRMARKYGR